MYVFLFVCFLCVIVFSMLKYLLLSTFSLYLTQYFQPGLKIIQHVIRWTSVILFVGISDAPVHYLLWWNWWFGSSQVQPSGPDPQVSYMSLSLLLFFIVNVLIKTNMLCAQCYVKFSVWYQISIFFKISYQSKKFHNVTSLVTKVQYS